MKQFLTVFIGGLIIFYLVGVRAEDKRKAEWDRLVQIRANTKALVNCWIVYNKIEDTEEIRKHLYEVCVEEMAKRYAAKINETGDLWIKDEVND